MKIKVGQKFRVGTADTGHELYTTLTKGNHGKAADTNKGIFASAKIQHGSQRIHPVFIFFSNPFKEGTQDTPWMDIIEEDKGYAIYHGDNKLDRKAAHEGFGNAKLIDQIRLYDSHSREDRIIAAPILLFQQCEVDGKTKGYRRFCGFGIPTRTSIRSQKRAKNGQAFSNLVFDLCLFDLSAEDELFDWAWIDALRGGTASPQEALKLAPASWRRWVNEGSQCLETIRRNVLFRDLPSKKEQLDMDKESAAILHEIHQYYTHDESKHAFEGLASFITGKVIGSRHHRGWITQKSGDGGVDFVSKLEVGDDLATCPMVILGQAKCIKPDSGVNAQDTARLVARLQRGWFGAVVTTGIFTDSALKEWKQDSYPLMLINGKRLAQEVKIALIEDGLNLLELLKRETKWFKENSKQLEPHRILQLW